MPDDDLKSVSLEDKITKDFGRNYLEVFQIMYSFRFIPIMQELAKSIGKEKLVEMLKSICCDITARQTPAATKNDDFSTFVAPMKEKAGFYQHTLTYDIIEDKEKSFEIRVRECLWAKVFREAGAADIGFAVICNTDATTASAFNPKIKLARTKTLMEGHECCNHRWEFIE